MKHIIALLLLLGAGSVYGQNFKGSIFFGPSFSHMRGDNMVGYNKPGYHLGFQVAYPVKKNLDISMAMSYSQKGSRRTYDQYGFPRGGGSFWHLLRAHYFEVPILVHYYFLDKFEVCGGLSFGRLMGERLVWTQGGGPSGDKNLRNYEYAIQLGAAYQWKDNWSFYVRHATSLYSVAPQSHGTILSRWNAGLLNFVAMVGLERKF
ncbi:outer membrane beta-barrel protein [bacterium]|nr:outer membrane beta-barrel protein [bacterium]